MLRVDRITSTYATKLSCVSGLIVVTAVGDFAPGDDGFSATTFPMASHAHHAISRASMVRGLSSVMAESALTAFSRQRRAGAVIERLSFAHESCTCPTKTPHALMNDSRCIILLVRKSLRIYPMD